MRMCDFGAWFDAIMTRQRQGKFHVTILLPLMVLMLSLVVYRSTAWPQTVPTPQEIISRIEVYLNSIQTLRSRFLQISPNRKISSGIFYLSRPGKMRLEYDSPLNDYIVSDGFGLFHWDHELQQQSSTLLSSSLASIILREEITLSGDVTVIGIDHNPTENQISVTLITTEDPEQGSLTLIFHADPMVFKQWTVVDVQRVITHVLLLSVETNIELNDWLFVFTPPEGFEDQE